jgi:hypothetical protein
LLILYQKLEMSLNEKILKLSERKINKSFAIKMLEPEKPLKTKIISLFGDFPDFLFFKHELQAKKTPTKLEHHHFFKQTLTHFSSLDRTMG